MLPIRLMKLIAVIAVALAILGDSCRAQLTINGSMPIHSAIFDKVISNFEFVLAKFDEPFAYGEKADEFKKISADTIHIPNLLCVTVGIADFGEFENADLARRFSVRKSEYPAYLLFRGRSPANYVRFQGATVQSDHIKQWLAKQTGLYMGRQGCVKELDELARSFVSAVSTSSQQAVQNTFAQLKSAAQRLTAPSSSSSIDNKADQSGSSKMSHAAQHYVKIAEKMMSKGAQFAAKEIDRLTRMTSQGATASAEKLDQLTQRINILWSFVKENTIGGGGDGGENDGQSARRSREGL